jgi:hypothetical protein
MNFKGFKKVGSKGDKTTFKHPQGHYISVNMKALSPKLKADLMAIGGDVHEETEEKGVSRAGEQVRNSNHFSDKKIKDVSKASAMGEHRKVLDALQSDKQDRKYMAEGGESDKKPSPQQAPQPAQPTQQPKPPQQPPSQPMTPEAISNGFKSASFYAEDGDVQQPEDSTAPTAKDLANKFRDINFAKNAMQEDAANNQPPAPGILQSSASAPQPMVSGANQPEQQPIEAEPEQTPDLSTAQGDVQQQLASDSSGQGQGNYNIHRGQAATQELNNEAQMFHNDLYQGKITPETYKSLYAKKDTLGKIGTIFGILVGGMGSGLTGQPNAAFDMMDKTIQRDLDAQKTSAVNAQNFLRLNQEQQRQRANIDNLDAETNTKAFANSQNQIYQASAHSLIDRYSKMSPQQQAAAAPAIGMLMKQMSAKVSNLNDLAGAAIATMNPPAGAPQGQLPKQGSKKGPSGPSLHPNSDGDYGIKPLLAPDAQNRFNTMHLNPYYDENYPQIREQFTGAQQADQALKTLGPTFENLAKNMTPLGRASQLVHNAEGLPFGIGNVLSGPTKATAMEEGKSKQYEAYKSTLLQDVQNAFKGTNISGAAIQKAVDDNTPVYGDTEQQILQKRTNLEGFIRRSIPHSLLSGQARLFNE